jgi:hypothetical protein
MDEEFEKGADSYKSLIECVETSINEENGEVAFICANGLKGMAETEQGNYFGDKLISFPRMQRKALQRREVYNLAIDKT